MELATSLLNDAGLWRARDLSGYQTASRDHRQSTGFPQLDALLIDGGWPSAALVEVLSDHCGIGELRLLGTALTKPTRDARWTVLINPPCVPYAPAFQALGINAHQLMVVHPSSHQEALWALEEVIVSGSTQTVLAWLSERDLKDMQLRRIQAKSKDYGVFSVLFRPLAAEQLPSAAELRLRIDRQSIDRKLVVSIVKRRGGWRVEGLELALPWGPTATDTHRTQQLVTAWERTKHNPTAIAA